MKRNKKKLEGIVSPIISKLYAGEGGMPGGMPSDVPGQQQQPSSSSKSGPNIEEVD
jgi:hypothetical protein